MLTQKPQVTHSSDGVLRRLRDLIGRIGCRLLLRLPFHNDVDLGCLPAEYVHQPVVDREYFVELDRKKLSVPGAKLGKPVVRKAIGLTCSAVR